MKRYFPLAAGCFLLMSGCNKNPFDRTHSSGAGPTGVISPGSFVIFNNELLSGGGAFEFPGSDNQSLSFADTSNPISRRSIRYGWTGGAVAGQVIFAGFDLMDTPTLATYSTTPGRNLTAAGYTKVTFYARGSLSTDTFVKIEVADDGNSATTDLSCVSLSTSGTVDDNVNPGSTPCGRTDTLSSAWKLYSIPIVSPSTSLANIKDFLKATFIFNKPIGSTAPGQGGVIYFDVIQYQSS